MVELFVFLGGLVAGVGVFVFGYKVGRLTKYQDMNVVPPPDAVKEILDGMTPHLPERFTHPTRPHGLSKEELEAERKKRGVIGPLEEPDLTRWSP